MDGPGDYYTKYSKSERERKISYDTTYMWTIKNYTNKLMATKGKWRGGLIRNFGLAERNYHIHK